MWTFWLGAFLGALLSALALGAFLFGRDILRSINQVAADWFPPAETRQLQAWRSDVLHNVRPVDDTAAQMVYATMRQARTLPARVLPITEERTVRVQVKW